MNYEVCYILFKFLFMSLFSVDVNILFLVFFIRLCGINVDLSILVFSVDKKCSFSVLEKEVLVFID